MSKQKRKITTRTYHFVPLSAILGLAAPTSLSLLDSYTTSFACNSGISDVGDGLTCLRHVKNFKEVKCQSRTPQPGQRRNGGMAASRLVSQSSSGTFDVSSRQRRKPRPCWHQVETCLCVSQASKAHELQIWGFSQASVASGMSLPPWQQWRSCPCGPRFGRRSTSSS